MTFKKAFKKLIGHEGGYVNHPDDPGGETNFGISKRSYPGEDIAGMTLDRAKVIYFRDYWLKAGCDKLPHPVDFLQFDAAVNSGVVIANMWLQRAVGTAEDGVLGPITLAAVEALHPYELAARVSSIRLNFMTRLSTWSSFGRGWARRIAGNLIV